MSAEKKAPEEKSVSILQSWEAFKNDKKLILPIDSIDKATKKVREALKLVHAKRHK